MDALNMFNDQYFYKAKKHVINTITKQEFELYKAGKIRKIYDSFEFMLLDNIKFYNRIIRTIILLYDNILIDHGKVVDYVEREAYKISMTPTKFYYLILCNIDSTRDEIIYAYDKLSNLNCSTFKEFFPYLIDITAFSFNLTLVKNLNKRNGLKTYSKLLESDITDEKFIKKVTNGFNRDSLYITPDSLENSLEESFQTICKMSEIYELLKDSIKDTDIIDIQPTCITLINAKSEFECRFQDGVLKRSSNRNFNECYEFDYAISKNLKQIYSWALESIPNHDNSIVELIEYLVKKYRRKFKAIRPHVSANIFSTLRVVKKWNNFFLEEFVYYSDTYSTSNNRILLRTHSYSCKEYNIGKMIYKLGYFIFGLEDYDMLDYKFKNFDIQQLKEYYMEFVYGSQTTIERELISMNDNLTNTIEKLSKIYE